MTKVRTQWKGNMKYNLYSVIEVTEIMSVHNYIIFIFKRLFSNSQVQNIPLDNPLSDSKDQKCKVSSRRSQIAGVARRC